MLFLDDLDAVCETIALTIGLSEEAIDLGEGLEHLEEVGSDAGSSVARALAGLDTARGAAREGSGPAPNGHSPDGRTANGRPVSGPAASSPTPPGIAGTRRRGHTRLR